jgi:N-methylhydantoinase A
MRRGVKEEVFDLRYQAPEPLVPRHHRYGVGERIAHDGTVLKALSAEPIPHGFQDAVSRGDIKAAAVCLMHAWANATHEASLAACLRARWPRLDVVCSHEVLPQVGFFDRVSTTVTTAYTMPIIRDYLGALEHSLAEAGVGGALFVITSAGGLMMPRDAIAQAARTVLSGPAAAPVAGARLAAAAGIADAIVVDMGGTSFDLSLVRDAAPVQASGGTIGGLRIAFPITDVRTIALGGGTIAWLDESWLLRLGPQSADANPGPACFGRGGTGPTITDANLMLGYLDPAQFEGSGLTIAPVLAAAALRRLGAPIGRDPLEVAVGVYRLAANQMADAIQRAALEAGLDYRKVALVVGGGAGPIHASAIGREIGARRIIVPPGAAMLCAMGALLLQPRYDAVRSLFSRLSQSSTEALEHACEGLLGQIGTTLRRSVDGLDATFTADLRYVGQEHPLATRFALFDLRNSGVETLRRAFEQVHRNRRGYILADEDIEVLGLRVEVAWNMDRPLPQVSERRDQELGHRCQRAYDVSTGSFRDFVVRRAESLRPGDVVPAPAIIEMIGTACVVSDPHRCVVAANRNLVLATSTFGWA